jgi:hypothetical protein
MVVLLAVNTVALLVVNMVVLLVASMVVPALMIMALHHAIRQIIIVDHHHHHHKIHTPVPIQVMVITIMTKIVVNMVALPVANMVVLLVVSMVVANMVADQIILVIHVAQPILMDVMTMQPLRIQVQLMVAILVFHHRFQCQQVHLHIIRMATLAGQAICMADQVVHMVVMRVNYNHRAVRLHHLAVYIRQPLDVLLAVDLLVHDMKMMTRCFQTDMQIMVELNVTIMPIKDNKPTIAANLDNAISI